MVSWDCAVVGLGAMGSATLWQLAGRGARVIGVDRFTPPHDRGSSHGESRIIRSAYFEDPSFLPLVRRAFALWRQLEAETGEALLAMSGAAMIGPQGSAVIEGSLRTARTHGLQHELLDAAQAARRFPQHRFAPDDAVLVESEGGVLAPERCVSAMLRRAGELGAEVRTACAVQRIEEVHGGAVRIHLDGGEMLDAARAVVCAGAWTSSLLAALPVPLWVERQVNAWFAVADPAAFALQAFPVFIRELPGGHFVYGIPALDGASIKLAVHHEGARVDDPDAVARDITGADVAPLARYAEERLAGVDPRPVRAITCLYTNTPDEMFHVAPAPGMERVTVVSACSGHGFKFAPAIGEWAATA